MKPVSSNRKKRRNPNGAGSWQKTKYGTWRFAITAGRRPDGKPNMKYFYGKTRKETRDKAEQYLRDRRDGIQVDLKTTFPEFAQFWFESHRKHISETTAEGCRYTLQKIQNCFGRRDLRSIRPVDVEQVLDMVLAEGYSLSYVRKIRGMMFQIFQKAEANDLIRKNPVQFAEKIRSVEIPAEKETYTAEEFRLLMDRLPHDRTGNSIRLLLCTGIRSQELLALEPRFIAEDGSCLYIRQAVKKVKGSVTVGPPKSRDGYRDIPVPAPFRQYAAALRQTDKQYIWEEGKPGSPCNPSYFQDQFRKAVRSVTGVRVLTPHCCRHTYVSLLQSLGVDVPTIQSLCGHAEADMTQHYLHVQENVRREAVERLGRAFSTAEEPEVTI